MYGALSYLDRCDEDQRFRNKNRCIETNRDHSKTQDL